MYLQSYLINIIGNIFLEVRSSALAASTKWLRAGLLIKRWTNCFTRGKHTRRRSGINQLYVLIYFWPDGMYSFTLVVPKSMLSVEVVVNLARLLRSLVSLLVPKETPERYSPNIWRCIFGIWPWNPAQWGIFSFVHTSFSWILDIYSLPAGYTGYQARQFISKDYFFQKLYTYYV